MNTNNTPTILIIEDSATQARRTAAEFSALDIKVIVASDGLQGLRVAGSILPALIILDVNLPKMDGYQVCSRLKRDPTLKHIPVIMLTANGRPEDALKGKAAGADEYIPKDHFAVEHLLMALEALGFLDVRKQV